jgi:hypothetical protein
MSITPEQLNILTQLAQIGIQTLTQQAQSALQSIQATMPPQPAPADQPQEPAK